MANFLADTAWNAGKWIFDTCIWDTRVDFGLNAGTAINVVGAAVGIGGAILTAPLGGWGGAAGVATRGALRNLVGIAVREGAETTALRQVRREVIQEGLRVRRIGTEGFLGVRFKKGQPLSDRDISRLEGLADRRLSEKAIERRSSDHTNTQVLSKEEKEQIATQAFDTARDVAVQVNNAADRSLAGNFVRAGGTYVGARAGSQYFTGAPAEYASSNTASGSPQLASGAQATAASDFSALNILNGSALTPIFENAVDWLDDYVGPDIAQIIVGMALFGGAAFAGSTAANLTGLSKVPFGSLGLALGAGYMAYNAISNANTPDINFTQNPLTGPYARFGRDHLGL